MTKAESTTKQSRESFAGTTQDEDSHESETDGLDLKTSIKLAKGQQCAWHPWRGSYATCSYCRRPFCYQDLVEHKKSYYCLEDIDTVFPEHEKMQKISEHNWSTIGGVLLMLTVAVFVVYFLVYGNTIQSLSTITNNLPASLLHANGTNMLSLIEAIFIALAFVAALMVLLGARGAFYLGMITCIGILSIFSYQLFTTTVTAQPAIMDTTAFLSFVTLIQARIIGVNASHRLKSKAKSELSDFKETRRF